MSSFWKVVVVVTTLVCLWQLTWFGNGLLVAALLAYHFCGGYWKVAAGTVATALLGMATFMAACALMCLVC